MSRFLNKKKFKISRHFQDFSHFFLNRSKIPKNLKKKSIIIHATRKWNFGAGRHTKAIKKSTRKSAQHNLITLPPCPDCNYRKAPFFFSRRFRSYFTDVEKEVDGRIQVEKMAPKIGILQTYNIIKIWKFSLSWQTKQNKKKKIDLHDLL